MKLYFNADEIFEMAEEIERQGALFYEKAASLFEQVDVREMLLDLAKMETGHEKLFVSMRATLLSDTYKGYEPDEMSAAYIKSFTDGKVFNRKRDICAELSTTSSLKDVLTMALEAEKNSIAFYTGIGRALPEAMSRQSIEGIIAEEMKHIVSLSEKLDALN